MSDPTKDVFVERDRLRAENRLLETVILDMAGELGVKPDNEEIIVAIERLRAENEKLRAALTRIAEQDAVEMALDPQWARRAAAAALKETGDE